MHHYLTSVIQKIFAEESPTIEVDETPKKNAPAIILIHGANATPKCFNYIRHKLPEAEYHIVDYNVSDGFYYNLDKMLEILSSENKEFKILSHSMGGIFAAYLSEKLNVSQSISISTPFGGVSFADWAKYVMPHYQLFRDVSTKSRPIIELKERQLSVPWKQIVTTRGSTPWMEMPNDSVVSVSSMEQISNAEIVYLHESHNEVLLSDDLIDIIRQDFFK